MQPLVRNSNESRQPGTQSDTLYFVAIIRKHDWCCASGPLKKGKGGQKHRPRQILFGEEEPYYLKLQDAVVAKKQWLSIPTTTTLTLSNNNTNSYISYY